MNCKELSIIAFKAAVCLDPEFVRFSSSKYPKDLGSWGLDESKLDELIRHLKKLKVELKVYDLNEDEFPDFKGKSLVELELHSDVANSKKVMDVLRRIKAFPLEQHHVVNQRQRKPKKEEEFSENNKKRLSLDKVKEIINEGFELKADELDSFFSEINGEITYEDDEGTKYFEISGKIKKEWFDKNYGIDQSLNEIAKKLSRGYSGGSGRSFSRSSFTLKSEGKYVKFVIIIHMGLDI